MTNHEGTVLIVDDNQDACASLAMLVMLEGFAPVLASKAAAGKNDTGQPG
jgi:DNA-binding NtrC family response regulator